MARLFISHASADNVIAIAFKQWLCANGWAHEDIFLDLDHIGAGERWKEALHKANIRCEAVILLASPNSLSSPECIAEVRKAEDYGKEIVVVLLNDVKLEDARLNAYKERQIVNLVAPPQAHGEAITYRGTSYQVRFNTDALAKVKDYLIKRGIAPEFFPWPPSSRPDAEPYPGLAAFGEDDAGIFFGRDADIMRGLDKLRILRRNQGPRVKLIQASSGAGKSSFLRAGLWPRLMRDSDFAPIAIVRPAHGILTGPDGLGRQIAKLLSRPDLVINPGDIHLALSTSDVAAGAQKLRELLKLASAQALAARRIGDPTAQAPAHILAVDQAEELLAPEDAEESKRFLTLLSHFLRDANDGIELFVIMTVRADSIDQLMQVMGGFGLDLPESLPLLPLPQSYYRDVIIKPIEVIARRGQPLKIEPALAEQIVKDTSGADALPLLAFTLSRLYSEYGSGRNLTLDQYKSMGGVTGSITKALKAALAQAGAAGTEESLRRLLIPHLATWDEDADAAKRIPTREKSLLSGDRASLAPLVEALVAARLLTRGSDGPESTIEVAHEALLRCEPIATWLRKDRDFLIFKTDATRAERRWREEMMADRALLQGIDVARGEEWLSRRSNELADDVKAFIQKSVARDRAEKGRQLRFQRLVSIGFAAAAVILAVVGTFAATKWVEADRELANSQSVHSLFLSEQANREGSAGDPGTAILLALEGLPDKTAKSARPSLPQAEMALDTGLRALRERALLSGHKEAVNSIGFRFDGQHIITGSEDATIRVWDFATGKPGTPIPDLDAGVLSVTYSPDGKLIAAVLDDTSDPRAVIFDAQTRLPVGKPLRGHTGKLHRVAFSPDGTLVATASEDATVGIWSVARGELVGAPLKGHEEGVLSVQFSNDGARIVTSSADRTARIWDVKTRELAIKPLRHHDRSVSMAVFSPDGKRVATVSWDNKGRIWDALTGEPIGEPLEGHTLQINSVAFSNDSRLLVTASADTSVRIWNAATGQPTTQPLRGHTNNVREAAFSPDGRHVVSVSDDRTVRIWAVTADDPVLRTFSGHAGIVRQAAFSPDGMRFATASEDGTAKIWSIESNEPIGEPLVHKAGVLGVAFSPDGRIIATSSSDNSTQLWNAETQARILAPLAHDAPVNSVAFNVDGKRIVTAAEDGSASVWNSQTGELVSRTKRADQKKNPLRAAAFSRDGTYIVTGSFLALIQFWDPSTGHPIGEPLTGHSASMRSVAVSPDGRLLATSSADGKARIWNLADRSPATPAIDVHSSSVRSIAFNRRGTQIVTASWDRTARIFDVKTGHQSRSPLVSTSRLESAAFSPGSDMVLVASEDGTIRAFRVFPDTQSLVDRAKSSVPRCMTLEQRRSFGLTEAPPPWCIELKKWPYHTASWESWLRQTRAGDKPALPADVE